MTSEDQAVPADGERAAPDWWIYRGGEPHDGIDRLPPPPRWRTFGGGPVVRPRLGHDAAGGRRLGTPERGSNYQVDEETIELVNTAMYLRRPLLVTGRPGTGKSTLAYSIAYELRLGPVLYWPITSRSTVDEGLYQYDAVGRLQEASLRRSGRADGDAAPDVGRYVRLGPLGTALLPQLKPRVLLLDELDKSDIDLPNDLLNVFEEGAFDIPQLSRLPEDQPFVDVMIHDGTDRVPIEHGRVACRAFPIVILTSNGERAFPPAFLRRCIRLEIKPPDEEKLAAIIASQLGAGGLTDAEAVIQRFLSLRGEGDVATDQLLNALYLSTFSHRQPEVSRERIVETLLRPLDSRAV